MEEERKIDLDEIRAMCYKIIDIIDFFKLMERTPNCNDCGKVRECKIAPMPGEQVRYNCHEWEVPDPGDY